MGGKTDYFPVMLDLDLVEQNIDEFAQIISAQRGDLTPQQVKDRMAEAIDRSRGERLRQRISETGHRSVAYAARRRWNSHKGVSRDTLANF